MERQSKKRRKGEARESGGPATRGGPRAARGPRRLRPAQGDLREAPSRVLRRRQQRTPEGEPAGSAAAAPGRAAPSAVLAGSCFCRGSERETPGARARRGLPPPSSPAAPAPAPARARPLARPPARRAGADALNASRCGGGARRGPEPEWSGGATREALAARRRGANPGRGHTSRRLASACRPPHPPQAPRGSRASRVEVERGGGEHRHASKAWEGNPGNTEYNVPNSPAFFTSTERNSKMSRDSVYQLQSERL